MTQARDHRRRQPGIALACAAALVLLAPAASPAATVRVVGDSFSDTMIYTAAPGEANDLSIIRNPLPGGPLQVVDGGASIDPQDRCVPAFPGVLCEHPSRIQIELGNRADKVVLNAQIGALANSVKADLGSGDDRFEYGALSAFDSPVEVNGRSGKDQLFGSDRKDEFTGGSGRDVVEGRNGNDRLFGGSGDDELKGEKGSDRIEGGPGKDRLNGADDGDKLVGGDANDILLGGDGNDNMQGDLGNDRFTGGKGLNTMRGGPGNDFFFSGSGVERFFGGPGRDEIRSNDGKKETVDCGDGDDTAIADAIDDLSSC